MGRPRKPHHHVAAGQPVDPPNLVLRHFLPSRRNAVLSEQELRVGSLFTLVIVPRFACLEPHGCQPMTGSLVLLKAGGGSQSYRELGNPKRT